MKREFRTFISGDSSNDDWRHFEFSRRSGLPRGYFDHRRIDPDFIVLVVCVMSLAVGLFLSL